MSTKKTIYDTLRKELPHIPLAYRYSNLNELPRMSFAAISNVTLKLSNKRHMQRVWYQIDYFSRVPLDIETDTNLNRIIEVLENENLTLTNWQEEEDINVETDSALFTYWIEVR